MLLNHNPNFEDKDEETKEFYYKIIGLNIILKTPIKIEIYIDIFNWDFHKYQIKCAKKTRKEHIIELQNCYNFFGGFEDFIRWVPCEERYFFKEYNLYL